MTVPGKRTRAQRKAAQRALWAEQAAQQERTKQQRREYERQHPVLSGAVRVVGYTPPAGNYTPATF